MMIMHTRGYIIPFIGEAAHITYCITQMLLLIPRVEGHNDDDTPGCMHINTLDDDDDRSGGLACEPRARNQQISLSHVQYAMRQSNEH